MTDTKRGERAAKIAALPDALEYKVHARMPTPDPPYSGNAIDFVYRGHSPGEGAVSVELCYGNLDADMAAKLYRASREDRLYVVLEVRP